MQVTLDHVLAVMDTIATGRTVASACRELGINPAAFYNLVNKDAELGSLLGRARAIQAEMLADKVQDLAENETVELGRAKLMSENTKWYLAKQSPGKFGDKIAVEVTHNVNLRQALEDAKLRVISTTSAPTPIADPSSPVSIAAPNLQIVNKNLTEDDDQVEVDIFS